jgi:outer membrane protein assembly factor BamB
MRASPADRLTGSAGAGLVEVELVEDLGAGHPDVDGGDGPPGAPKEPGKTGHDEPAAERRWFRRPGPVLALALVVFAVGANVAEVRADAARRAALRAHPGIVEPLVDPLTEVWSVEGNMWGASGLDDTMLVSVDGTTPTMQAVDTTSGAVLWERSAPDTSAHLFESCSPLGAASRVLMAWYQGVPPDSADTSSGERLLMCQSYGPEPRPGDLSPFDGAEISVIDGRTGRSVSTLAPGGYLLTAQGVDDDVLTVAAQPDGHVVATRWEPVSGRVVWQTTSGSEIFSPGTATLSSLTSDEAVMSMSARGRFTFSVETGEELDHSQAPGGWTERMPLPDGGSAVWTYDEAGGHGRVENADGSLRFELPGSLLRARATDGGVPGVLLVSDDRGDLQGLDAASGTVIWTLEADVAAPLVDIDGVLVMQTGSTATAVDGRDGTVLWTRQTSSAAYADGISDGEVVLLLEKDVGVDGAPPLEPGDHLVARDLHDGSERWRTPVAPGAYAVTATLGGRVVVLYQDRVVGMG